MPWVGAALAAAPAAVGPAPNPHPEMVVGSCSATLFWQPPDVMVALQHAGAARS